MRSSTSSSDAGRVEPGQVEAPAYVRPVPAIGFTVPAVLAVTVFLLLIGAWEAYWRSEGAVPAIANTDGLWTRTRRRIDAGEGTATVLVGSSRTLSNFQLDVWARERGERPIQLALEGTTPVPVMEQLAADTNFRGELIVGVASDLFFSGFAFRRSAFELLHTESYSQRAGQWLSMTFVEPFLAFDDTYFALFTVLARQPWPDRPGAKARIEVPKIFVGRADRNNRMWRRAEEDTVFQRLVQRVWAQNFGPRPGMTPERAQEIAQAQIDRAAAAVKTLQARGVRVTFVRHPTSGGYAAFEAKALPRERTWEPLLRATGARGIHFADYPALQGYELVEWSHMTGEQADRYTADVVRLLGPPAPRGGAAVR